jgi:hypothetical protein
VQAALDDGFRTAFRGMVAGHLAGGDVDVSGILFPHFLSGEVEIDGVAMRPLTDEDGIVEEGREMDHCVGSYVGRAREGRSLLISQISAHGRSTVEVGLVRGDDGAPALEVVQNKAAGNAEPPPAHVAAVAKLLKSFAEQFRRDLERRIGYASTMAEEDKGYEMLTPGELAALKEVALADLRRFVPKALRRASVPEWIAAMRAAAEAALAADPDDEEISLVPSAPV